MCIRDSLITARQTPDCDGVGTLIPSSARLEQQLSLIHISEPTRLLSISYAVFCLKKKNLNFFFFFFLMIRRPPRSTLDRSSAASDVYKRQPDCDGVGTLIPSSARLEQQ